jgi:hypothetical protein
MNEAVGGLLNRRGTGARHSYRERLPNQASELLRRDPRLRRKRDAASRDPGPARRPAASTLRQIPWAVATEPGDQVVTLRAWPFL